MFGLRADLTWRALLLDISESSVERTSERRCCKRRKRCNGTRLLCHDSKNVWHDIYEYPQVENIWLTRFHKEGYAKMRLDLTNSY